MATSGSTDWTATRDDIIQQILENCKVVDIGASPAAVNVTDTGKVLNRIVKRLQTDGIRLWALNWTTKTFSASSEVTNNSTVYTCIRSLTSSSTSEPGVGADSSTYWVEGGTEGAAAYADATSYSSIGDFVAASDTIGIDTAFIRRNGTDHLVKIVGYNEYFRESRKETTGLTSMLWFSEEERRVYLSDQPSDVNDVLHYMRVTALEDFDSASDDPDFPVRWVDLLVAEGTYAVSSKYDLPLQERNWFRVRAEELKVLAKRDDQEKTEDNFVRPI
jgi:hypothetical protein